MSEHNPKLPSADYRARIETLLDCLSTPGERSADPWVPTEAHAEISGPHLKVTYIVKNGPLEGTYEAAGPAENPQDIEEAIFRIMVKRLNNAWKKHLEAYSVIAGAMRAVGI